jgi:hypothetical protein
MPVPTDIPTRRQPPATSELELVALFSLLPCIACVLLARAYPAVARAFVLLGRLS